jgi:hypothetical protein
MHKNAHSALFSLDFLQYEVASLKPSKWFWSSSNCLRWCSERHKICSTFASTELINSSAFFAIHRYSDGIVVLCYYLLLNYHLPLKKTSFLAVGSFFCFLDVRTTSCTRLFIPSAELSRFSGCTLPLVVTPWPLSRTAFFLICLTNAFSTEVSGIS